MDSDLFSPNKLGVRWHRIAEPFGVDSSFNIDTVALKDYWVLAEKETWNRAHKPSDTLRASAPARVSRGLPLARVINIGSNHPFVLSSRYSNGAVAIVTIGRRINREYISERIKVEQDIESLDKPIGIFGDYESLALVLSTKIKASEYMALGQDLAGDIHLDITKEIIFKDDKIIIFGDVIRKIGLSATSKVICLIQNC